MRLDVCFQRHGVLQERIDRHQKTGESIRLSDQREICDDDAPCRRALSQA